jgi:hypothetical protein
MEKKRSKGITILAVLMLLNPLLIVGYILNRKPSFFSNEKAFLHVSLSVMMIIFSIVCGVGLLKLKEWARRFTIYFYILAFIRLAYNIFTLKPEKWSPTSANKGGIILLLIPLLWLIIIAFFLTRPKVKEQFS